MSTLRTYAKALRSGIVRPKPGPVPASSVSHTMTIEPQLVAEFCRTVGTPVSSTVPASYLHTLGFLPSMELMTAEGFPLPVLGMVHVFNSFTQHRPVGVTAQIDVHVRMSEPRLRGRGTEIDVLVTGSQSGEICFDETSTYFAKTVSLASATARAEPVRLTVPQTPDSAQWVIPTGIGQRYARVSGDYNVIHLNSFAAKAFGFPAAIAHGMYTAARGLAAVDVRAERFTWDVQFAKPLVLPATVGFRVDRSAPGELSCAVVRVKDGAPYVISRIGTGSAEG